MSNKKNAKTMKASQITYKITDTNSGMFAEVNLPEGTFNLSISFKRGMNNRRETVITGNYPTEKYMISYDGGLVILEKGGDYEIGQELDHKAFGKGIVEKVSDKSITINFAKVGQKTMMKSIIKNFLN